jgi:hypothetical protein
MFGKKKSTSNWLQCMDRKVSKEYSLNRKTTSTPSKAQPTKNHSRDMKFKSQEKHEQNYKNKRPQKTYKR